MVYINLCNDIAFAKFLLVMVLDKRFMIERRGRFYIPPGYCHHDETS